GSLADDAECERDLQRGERGKQHREALLFNQPPYCEQAQRFHSWQRIRHEATEIDAMRNELREDSEPRNVSRHIRITGDDAGCRPSARNKLFRRDLARVSRVDTEAVRDAEALSGKTGDLGGRMSDVAVDVHNRVGLHAA